MQWARLGGLTCVTVLVCAGQEVAAQQVASPHGEATSRWEHVLSLGALATPTMTSGNREPPLGAILMFDARKQRPGKRVSFASSLQLSAKGRGESYERAAGQNNIYRVRNDMVSLTIGPDIALTRGRTLWSVGLGAGPAMSRMAYRLQESTPSASRGWGTNRGNWRYTGVVLARTNLTVPASDHLHLRFGLQTTSGVEALTDNQPIVSGTLGVVLRR